VVIEKRYYNVSDRRWMKGLNSDLVNKILIIEPDEISIRTEEPLYISFQITKGNECYRGVSICSPIEFSPYVKTDDIYPFSHKKGRSKAAGRALSAFYSRRSSMPIRTRFPNRWMPKQIKLLKKVAVMFGEFKSIHETVS